MSINEANSQHRSQHNSSGNGGSSSTTFRNPTSVISPLPRSSGSEYFNAFRKKLDEIYKAATENPVDGDNTEFTLLPMSREQERNDLFLSALIVCVRLRDVPELGVAFHLIPLGATASGEITPYVDTTTGGKTISVRRATCDAVDDFLIDRAGALVRAFFGVTPDRCFFADATAIGNEFDRTNDGAYWMLARDAVNAGLSELARHRSDFADLDLTKVTRNGQLSAELSFGKQQLQMYDGTYRRSDIQVSFTSRTASENKSRSLHGSGQSTRFSRVSGFINPLWNPLSDAGIGMNYFGQQGPTQKFAPEFVMTDIELTEIPTMGSVLFAIATTLAITHPRYWTNALKPSIDDDDMWDLGYLNIDANLPTLDANGKVVMSDPNGFGAPIEIRGADVSTNAFNQLIAQLFQLKMMFSIDIPESGIGSYYLSIFDYAADGSGEAYNVIVNAGNQLTNNVFGQELARQGINGPRDLFAGESRRIHNGIWIDHKGRHRDIRDFDHLSLSCLIGRKDPEALRLYSDTFLRTSYPEALRMEERAALFDRVTDGRITYTGFSRRHTLAAGLLTALDTSIAAQHLRAPVRTQNTGDFYTQRAAASWAARAQLDAGSRFMTGGDYSGAYTGNIGRNSGGRW